MSRRAPLPHSRHHIPIFDEDWEWLDARYGVNSANRRGAGSAIRTIVHYHVRALRQRMQDVFDADESLRDSEAQRIGAERVDAATDGELE